MQLETINFPSDLDSAMGALSRELCKALHMASEHPDHAALLDSFLKFSTKQLIVAKKDFRVRKEILAKREATRVAKEKAAEQARLTSQVVKVETKIQELTEEKTGLSKQLEEGT